MHNAAVPVVLAIGGNDPSGGAGIQADIQALSSLGCHPAPVITALTAQDSKSVKQFSLVDNEMIIAQARAVLEDMPVAAIKTGMLGDASIINTLAGILNDYPRIPLVVDPVMASGAGQALAEGPLEDAYKMLLLPHTTVATPNSMEARLLAQGADTLTACAHELLSLGCEHVLITGTHEPGEQVTHCLYSGNRQSTSFEYPRLPGEFHGSGCTLAAAIAAGIAHGVSVPDAIIKGLDYTWQTLKHAHQLGMGQAFPDRLYWSRDGGPQRA
jgi:hydroxymethylpyrimidine/phosphomethylpyrimidine kinase